MLSKFSDQQLKIIINISIYTYTYKLLHKNVIVIKNQKPIIDTHKNRKESKHNTKIVIKPQKRAKEK